MLALFWCRHRNNVCFFGIDIVVSTKTYSAGYIYQKGNGVQPRWGGGGQESGECTKLLTSGTTPRQNR